MQNMFSIPDGLIHVRRTVQGQIEFVGRSPQVLVGVCKDGRAEFHGLICRVIIRVNGGASFKKLSQS
jgi:hypothetical protein